MTTPTRPPVRQSPDRRSLWQATVAMPSFSPLTGDVRADVCVVGGGITGLTTAYLLGRAGKTVVVLEDGELASGMTSATTAHLASAIDDRFIEIERLHGERGARLAAESHAAAIDRIEEIVLREGIACDFQRVDGYLFLAPESERDLLERELDAARRAGLTVELVGRAPIEGFDTGPCLRFARQGQVHPLAYLSEVARALVRDGGRIFTNTHADEIDGGPPAHIRTGNGSVRASSVVVATNSPVIDRVAIHSKQVAHITYAIAAPISTASVPAALYWDTADPYHYVRVHGLANGDRHMLIVGGEDHPTGRADDTEFRHDRLERWARERFPHMGPVEHRWAGQVMESIDGLAFIGRNPLDTDNVYVATGDSGMGMTHGTIAGMLITDLITGRPNVWAELYEPSRKPLRAAVEYAKDAMAMTAQYADWVTGGDVDAANEISPGSGAVLRRGLMKVAAYRDPRGELHERSAVCTHLGCIVQWNAAERTWDCPCHGSRFDCMGTVINGPANRDLSPASEARDAHSSPSPDVSPPSS